MSKEFKMGFIEEVEPLKLTTIPKKYQKLIEATENRWFNKMQKLAKICQKRIDDLEHRLSNCIEPKFKQGDKCYGIIDTFAYTDVFPVEIRNTHLLYEVWDGEDTTKQHSTRIFATEEEAKKHLEALKNE